MKRCVPSTFAAPALLLLFAGAFQAQSAAQVRTPQDSPVQGLPLRQVALFSSGVGYFGRSGTVTGDSEVELFFRRDDLNDILKSMVITDPSGELRPLTYSIEELLARRPQNDLPLNESDSLGGVLRRFQGALIEIETPLRPGSLRGRLIGVANRTIRDKENVVQTVEVATILQENGLASVRLDLVEEVGIVRLLDEALDRKLREQLQERAARLTTSIDAGYRPVRLHFAGRGTREVRTGYIQATSVWKTTYRLVFDSAKKNEPFKPLLQGWAIVENTTEEDWKDVSLSLIAGRPVSFRMNLAAPLYVQRPEVALPFAGTPAPRVYEEAVRSNRLQNMPAPSGPAGPAGAAGPPGLQDRAQGIFSNSGDFDRRARADVAVSAEQIMKQQASASTAERGELFEYAIRQPVSLNRGNAALVPIVSQSVSGEKLSILDTREANLRPVYGMRLRNTTGLHLAGGPITIYQDGLYAGDAQITNIAPGDHRLISYALDLDLIVGREEPTHAQDTMGLSAKAGVLTVARRQRRTLTFTFRNKAATAKTVLVQMPIDPNFTLVAPATADEKSPTEYRFEVEVPANGNAELDVVTERTLSEGVALLKADVDTLLTYTRFGKISPQLKTALEGVVTRRNTLRDLQGRRSWLEQQVKEISEEQSRIRQNMNSLSRESDLYKLYVAKLTEQESQIEKLHEEIARLRDAENAASKELSTYVQSLNFES